MSIYQWYQIEYEYIDIRFDELPATSTLVNANFVLYDTSLATPAVITDAFKTIELTRDYFSISRTIRLWFDFSLSSNNSYRLDISNLKTIIGEDIANDSIAFETLDLSGEVVNDLPPDREPVDVEDYSIKNISSLVVTSLPSNDATTLEATLISPSNDIRYYLATTATEGRIDIKFNQIPAANFISSDYFKVQRKAVSRTISRWEDVNALITADTVNDYVYIYLPSLEDTPVYGEPDKEYWESGYKYRVRILAGVGI